jgi:rod shape-determining protein MreB
MVRPRIIIGIPSEVTQVEKRAVKDSALKAKASEVYLVDQAMAAAIGARAAHHRALGQHGGGHRGRHHGHRGDLAGRHRLQQVGAGGRQRDGRGDHPVHQEEVQPAHRERTAEQIKLELGSAFPLDEPLTMEIKGRDLIEGIPKTLTITDAEIREALAEPSA